MNTEKTKYQINDPETGKRRWALILGGSKGLGLATAQKLASIGFGIIAVHRDRKADLHNIELNYQRIRSSGVPFLSYNSDAVMESKRRDLILKIRDAMPEGDKIGIMVHSIAKGHLNPMFENDRTVLSGADLQITVHAMAISLYEWTKELFDLALLANDTRIIAFTSEGSSRVLRYYAAVSAAKSALESIVRSIAMEFAQQGIRANCIQAGVTDTESLRRIPGSDSMMEVAARRNPSGRLTTAKDVANVVALLCSEEARWITGSVLKVDGGESLV